MHKPNIEAQRAAMQKLAFLIGDWSGDERGEWIEHADLTIGSHPPQKLIDLTVRRA
jgi:hypothetical protein